MVTLGCTEGQPLPFGPEYDEVIRKAVDRLSVRLRPTLRILREVDGRPTLQGIVGSVRLDPITTLEIAPKVPVGADWVPAVLDLLIGATRLDVGRDRLAGVSPRRRVLLDLMAAVYAGRLQAALRRDGPLLILTRTEARLPVLKGKLQVGRWAREFLRNPTTFPVTFDQLSADNDFSRAMAVVARILAVATSESRVRASLMESAHALRPGAPDVEVAPAGIVHRPLPAQWMVYRPAWSVAVAVLSQRALLGRHGRLTGVEVVVEAWPLLEELLTRALAAVSVQANSSGRSILLDPSQATLLTPVAAGQDGRTVQPDGRLSEASQTLATFEAKYSPRMSNDWPSRPHVFQALATAAACDSPLAVLVYPESFPPIWWRVEGFHSRPGALAAVGVDLFGYRSGSGDLERGRMILQILAGPPAATSAIAGTLSGAA